MSSRRIEIRSDFEKDLLTVEQLAFHPAIPCIVTVTVTVIYCSQNDQLYEERTESLSPGHLSDEKLLQVTDGSQQ